MTVHQKIEVGKPLRASFQPLHDGQKTIVANLGERSIARCGRRFGKTTLLEELFAKRAIVGRKAVGWFCPEYKLLTPTYDRLIRRFGDLIRRKNASTGLVEFLSGGSIEFWTLDNPDAGRSRAYDEVVIDEASLKLKGLDEVVERAIMPTLLDRAGSIVMAGTPKGIDEESYFYKACVDKSLGWREFHAPTWGNPWLDAIKVANLRNEYPSLVYQQEFCADFVDWSGAAFFSLDALTEGGEGAWEPERCDTVLAVIDTATKTGREHDGTAVAFAAYTRWPTPKVVVLDWDLRQIEGSLLEHWLPQIFVQLEYWRKRCGARAPSLGAFIEDKSSGMVLLQQAARRNLPAQAIDSKLTSVGKDERAISISGYVHRGWVKFGREALAKTVNYKGVVKNHLRGQVVGYRVANKELAEDDLLDCFCYAVAIACGDTGGF